MRKKNPGLRFAALDIECTNLRSTYGRILCVCVRFFDDPAKKVYSFQALNWDDEKKMLVELKKCYDEIDVIVSYNGKLFDIPYINGRRMQLGLTPLHPKKHVDLLYQARKLRFASASLQNAGQLLGLKQEKFHVHPKHWVRAANGVQRSADLILHHCEKDVIMTQEMCEAVGPLVQCISR